MNNISETIKKLCEEEGIKISDLEKEAGLSRAAISRWKDELPKSIVSLIKISQILNVSTDYLLGLDGSKSSNESIMELLISKTETSEIEWERVEYSTLKNNPLNLLKNLSKSYHTYIAKVKKDIIIFIYCNDNFLGKEFHLFLNKNGEYIPIKYKINEIEKLNNIIENYKQKAIVGLLDNLQSGE